MTWYTTGTISVTNGSPTVYGTGTLWVDTGTLNAGDITLIGSSLYQVQSIQSNTQLTLSSNFLGTTASGASYAIIPIGLLPSALAQQVKTTLASASSALTSAVLNTAGQAMTTTQQLNARQNIGALGAADVGQGYVSLSVAGNTNVALSSTQAQASIINLTGTLTGNISVSTSMTPRLYIVENATTGAFTLTFIGSSGTGAVVPQGGSSLLFCDGTNIYGLISFVGSITELSGGLKTAHNTLDDGSGNMGLSVTPSAWSPTSKVIQIPSGAIESRAGNTEFSLNCFYNGTNWIYESSNFASLFVQSATGQNQWFTAPSGTAGSAISFTQAMTLDNSGNLLVGTTSLFPSSASQLSLGFAGGSNQYGITLVPAADNTTAINFLNAAKTQIGSIGTTSTATAYNTTSDPRLKNISGPLTTAAATAFVNGLKPLVGTWKADGSPFCGFLTTDYAQSDPGSVVGQPDATQPVGTLTHTIQLGDVTDSTGKTITSSVPQPSNLPTGQKWTQTSSETQIIGENVPQPANLPSHQTWTETGTAPVYQQMEYASPAWCANMTAALQGALATIAEMQSLLHTAGIKGF